MNHVPELLFYHGFTPIFSVYWPEILGNPLQSGVGGNDSCPLVKFYSWGTYIMSPKVNILETLVFSRPLPKNYIWNRKYNPEDPLSLKVEDDPKSGC